MTQMWQTTVSVMMNLNGLRHVHGYQGDRFLQWMHLHFEDHECKEAAYAASQLTVNL